MSSASIKKPPLDMTTDIEFTTTENDKYISTPYLGDVTVFYLSRKAFPRNRMAVLNPKIKFGLKGIFASFVPSVLKFSYSFLQTKRPTS